MHLVSQKLVIHKLSFENSHQLLFDDLHCTVHAGEILEITGANGSGKTTLLRMLAGYIRPEQESIFWNDESIFKKNSVYQQQVHYIGHQNGVKLSLTAEENLELYCALSSNLRPKISIEKALEKMKFHSLRHTLAMHFSAGQLRRLSLMRLLLNPLPIWILDEPTASLDKEGEILLTQLINQHLTNGGIVILATHQPLLTLQNKQTLCLGAPTECLA